MKPQRLTLDQASLEWHEHRLKHRNASETPAVMGVSPWLSPRAVYELRQGLKPPLPKTPAMQQGQQQEPLARAAFNTQQGGDYQPAVWACGDYSASLDGYCEETQSLVEIKCPVKGQASPLWQAVQQGQIPDHYRLQIEHQLACSGATQAYLWVWDAEQQQGLLSAPLKPDPAQWARIQAAWDQFIAHPPAEQIVLERTDAEWLALAEKYRVLEAQQSRLGTDLAQTKQQLLALCTEDKQQGGGITVTRYQREGSVDYQKIPALKGLDLSSYRKPPVSQMRITLAKGAWE